VYCLDADSGRELWRFKTNGSVDEVCYNQGRLYFGSWDCHMYCLDAQTGKLIWKFKTSLGTPSPIEPPETGAVTSAQVTWQTSEEETKKDKKGEQQLSDYADTKNEYASSGMGDYLGKKKRGYV
jgi:outer membrane protein assembly factor BamB